MNKGEVWLGELVNGPTIRFGVDDGPVFFEVGLSSHGWHAAEVWRGSATERTQIIARRVSLIMDGRSGQVLPTRKVAPIEPAPQPAPSPAGPYGIGSPLWPGLSKLIEESGEVGQVIGKIIGAGGERVHFDGTDLRQELQNELGDLLAAIWFVIDHNDLSAGLVHERQEKKRAIFKLWHGKPHAPSQPVEPVRVLVTGGRHYDDRDHVFRTLDELAQRLKRPLIIVHGACGATWRSETQDWDLSTMTGADALAERWAREARQIIARYPAKWHEHGRKAGPLRNAEMVKAGAQFVVAFPGGSGTADCLAKATAAGITVWTSLEQT